MVFKEISLSKIKDVLSWEFFRILLGSSGLFWALFFWIIFIALPLYLLFRKIFPDTAKEFEDCIKDQF